MKLNLQSSTALFFVLAIGIVSLFARKEHQHLHRMTIVCARTLLKVISTFLGHTFGKEFKHFDAASLKGALS